MNAPSTDGRRVERPAHTGRRRGSLRRSQATSPFDPTGATHCLPRRRSGRGPLAPGRATPSLDDVGARRAVANGGGARGACRVRRCGTSSAAAAAEPFAARRRRPPARCRAARRTRPPRRQSATVPVPRQRPHPPGGQGPRTHMNATASSGGLNAHHVEIREGDLMPMGVGDEADVHGVPGRALAAQDGGSGRVWAVAVPPLLQGGKNDE